MNPEIEKLNKSVEDLQGKATEALTALKEGSLSADDQKAMQDQISGFEQQLKPLTEEREKLINAEAQKALVNRMETLEKAIEAQRKPMSLPFGAATPAGDEKALYGAEGETSYYNDVRLGTASNRDTKALERMSEIADMYEGKAMVEGTPESGGFLVPPDVANELITLRDAGGVLRSLFSSTSISVDELQFVRQDNGLAVAWTAELAEKIQSELKFSAFSARVFTAAGLAVASNQLLADAKWSVDQMINRELAKRFVWLEELAFLNGTGEGEPLGLLRTPGIEILPVKEAAKVAGILDGITDAITGVYTDFYAPPTAIVMHPRRWGALVKARVENEAGTYMIGAGSNVFGRNANDALPGYGSGPVPRGELYGIPVYTTPAVPTNLGTGTNEDCVFVGDFGQGLVLNRQGITTDRSEHVYFTSNQTIFRSEERVGFTAGRYPSAFKVVAGDAFAV